MYSNHFRSESDLHNYKENSRRKSLSSMTDKTNEDSMKFIIKLQQALISDYKNQLNHAKDEILHCKENFDMIKKTNDFNADDVTNLLIHHAKNNTDKEIFKNAIIFMQNKLNLLLEKFENDIENDENI